MTWLGSEVKLRCFCADRYNLAPRGDVSDEMIWLALENVQLKDTVAALPDQLGMSYHKGGVTIHLPHDKNVSRYTALDTIHILLHINYKF